MEVYRCRSLYLYCRLNLTEKSDIVQSGPIYGHDMATAGTGGVAGGGGFNEEPEDSCGTGLETVPRTDPIPGLVRRNVAGGQTLASLAGTGSVVQLSDVLAILAAEQEKHEAIIKPLLEQNAKLMQKVVGPTQTSAVTLQTEQVVVPDITTRDYISPEISPEVGEERGKALLRNVGGEDMY